MFKNRIMQFDHVFFNGSQWVYSYPGEPNRFIDVIYTGRIVRDQSLRSCEETHLKSLGYTLENCTIQGSEVSVEKAIRGIFALKQPWEKKLPHCPRGKPLYTSEDYALHEEEQNYEYLWSPKEGKPLQLFVAFRRDIEGPTETIWGMRDRAPIVTVGTQEYKLRVISNASLRRFLEMLATGGTLAYRFGDPVYFQDKPTCYKGMNLGTILAIADFGPRYLPTWCVQTVNVFGWVREHNVGEGRLITTYDPQDYIDVPLVNEMLESLTSHREVHDEAMVILEKNPVSLDGQREFIWLSRRLWTKFVELGKEEGRYLSNPTEETLDAFASELRYFYETP